MLGPGLKIFYADNTEANAFGEDFYGLVLENLARFSRGTILRWHIIHASFYRKSGRVIVKRSARKTRLFVNNKRKLWVNFICYNWERMLTQTKSYWNTWHNLMLSRSYFYYKQSVDLGYSSYKLFYSYLWTWFHFFNGSSFYRYMEIDIGIC